MIIAGPARGVGIAWQKWRILQQRSVFSITTVSVVVWYSKLSATQGTGTSIEGSPPPLCFYLGN